MATFTVNKPAAAAGTVIQKLDLNSAPHTFTFNSDRQFLVVENGESVPITVNVVGDSVTTFDCPTYGNINVSAGHDLITNAGETTTLYTRLKGAFLGSNGNAVTLTVTGSTAANLAYGWIEEF